MTEEQTVSVVTGGAGFLGSHLCERLLAEGHEVICIDNLITGSQDNIAHLEGKPGFTFVRYDVTDFLSVNGPVHNILHFASPASPLDYLKYPIQTLKVGSLGTHKALGLARNKKSRFLLASTSEIYGDPQVHPQPEWYWGNVNPIGVRGVYDEAKRFAEAMTMAYHRTHDVDTRIARIFNTYGPRMRVNDGRAIPAFISNALENKPVPVSGDGTQTRSICYVTDLVDGIIRLLETPVHDPVNLGNPDEISMIDLAKECISLTGSRSAITFTDVPVDDPKCRRPDIGLARKMLEWEPKISRQEGLAKTIIDFRKRLRAAGQK